MALTWSGLLEENLSEEEEFMASMSARLQAMTLAAQAKDAALEDLQTRLKAALKEVEQGRAREAALLRRAEISEEAEEALAAQMAELEAEAFTHITQANNKLLTSRAASRMEPDGASQLSNQVGKMERQLQAAMEEAAAWERRCKDLEKEAEEGKIREAAFQRRVVIAEEAEEALASQMAELEAEAFARITENNKLLVEVEEGNVVLEERRHEEAQQIARSQVAEMERRLAEAREELEAAHAKLRQAEEKNRLLEKRMAEPAQEKGEAVTLKRRKGGAGGEALLAVTLQDLAGLVKLKLWNPSSLAVTSPS